MGSKNHCISLFVLIFLGDLKISRVSHATKLVAAAGFRKIMATEWHVTNDPRSEVSEDQVPRDRGTRTVEADLVRKVKELEDEMRSRAYDQLEMEEYCEMQARELRKRKEATAKSTRSGREVIPEKYDGTSSWRSYMTHFEACKQLNEWDDDIAEEWLAARLMGKATRVLEEDRDGYEDLKNLLSAEFGPSDGVENYSAELKSRRRRPGESLKELGQSIKDLVRLAYPELPKTSRDRLGREYFKEALEDAELRQAIFRAKPSSLDEAVAAAKDWELFVKTEKTRRGRATAREMEVLAAKVDKLTQQFKKPDLPKPLQSNPPTAWNGPPSDWSSSMAPPRWTPNSNPQSNWTQAASQQPPSTWTPAVSYQPPSNWTPPAGHQSQSNWTQQAGYQPQSNWTPPAGQQPQSNWAPPSNRQPQPSWTPPPRGMPPQNPRNLSLPFRPGRKDYSKVLCWHCGQLGHIFRQCPAAGNSNGPTPQSMGTPQEQNKD